MTKQASGIVGAANVFVQLTEHLGRQHENYLTQTLAVVFNASPQFRRELTGLLAGRRPQSFQGVNGVSASLSMQTQQGFRSEAGRGILDGLVRDDSGKKRLLFEVKLTAPISVRQLKKYRTAFRCPIILLGPAPNPVDLPPALRRSILTLSWAEVFEAANRAYRRTKRAYPKALLEDWMAFLSTKGIVPPRPLRATDWKRIGQLARVIKADSRSGHMRDQLPDVLEGLAAATRRLEMHRDRAWGSLGDAGWTPFSGLYRYHEDAADDDSPHIVSLDVGYYRVPTKKSLRRRLYRVKFHYELELRPTLTLSACCIRVMKKAHPDYDSDEGNWYTVGSEKHQKSLKKIFALDFEAAHARHMAPYMKKALTAFKKTKGWREAMK